MTKTKYEVNNETKEKIEVTLNSQTVKAISAVLRAQKDRLTMLDKTFLPNDFPALAETFDDLKNRLYDDTQNACILAYFLAIYNTYIMGRMINSDIGRRVKELISVKTIYYRDTELYRNTGSNKATSKATTQVTKLIPNKEVYFTSAKLITMLAEVKDKTGLCKEDAFWKAAAEYKKKPSDKSPEVFNDLQMQKICCIAYSFDTLSDSSDNNLLYLLLNLKSSFLTKGLKGHDVAKYRRLVKMYTDDHNATTDVY